MTSGKPYGDAARDAFVQRAGEIGQARAREELGYPATASTASLWCKALGVRPTQTALMQYAANIQAWYGKQEKLGILQALLDSAYDMLQNGERDTAQEILVLDEAGQSAVDYFRTPLDAKALSSLSGTVVRTLQAMELLEGRVTDRQELVLHDGTDLELRELIDEARARNAVEQARLCEPPVVTVQQIEVA